MCYKNIFSPLGVLFYKVLAFNLLMILLSTSCAAPEKIDEALIYLSKEAVHTEFLDITKALKKESRIHKIDEYDEEQGYLSISSSDKLITEHLTAKLFKGKNNEKILITALSTTTIVPNQESLSGLDGPVPAYSLKIKAFAYRSRDWVEITDEVLPKELAHFLMEYYNFDLESPENNLPLTANFRKEQLILQSQELKVDKIISLIWKEDHLLIQESIKTLKMKNVHPALAGLEPTNQKVGLLLGLSTKDGYRSYWLIFENDSANLKAEFDYVINKQENDFYYFDKAKFNGASFCVREKCQQNKSVIIYSKNFDEFLQRRKAASTKVKFDIEKNDRCLATIDDEEITYIGKDFYVVSIKKSKWGCTEESKSAFDSTYLKVVPLGNMNLSLANYTNDVRLKNAEKQLLKKAIANSKNEDLSLSELGKFVSFNIKREKGIINLYGQTQKPVRNAFSYGVPSYRTCETYISIAPPVLANYPNFPLKYDVLLGYVKEMRDCLVSPSQNVVCVLDDRELRCLEPTGKNVLFTLPLYKEILPNIISVEWAVGEEVDAWDKVIQQRIIATPENQ